MARFPDWASASIRALCAITAAVFFLSLLVFPAVKGWQAGTTLMVQGYLLLAAGALVVAVWRHQRGNVERFGRWLASLEHVGLKILLVAFALRLAGIAILQYDLGGDPGLHELRIWQVSQGEGYITPDKGPDPHWPPGYVFFMSPVYWLFGRSLTLLKAANGLLDAVSAVVVWRLALAFWKDEATARLGAVTYAVNPALIAVSQVIIYAPLLNLLLLLLALCIRKSAVLWGLLLGASALVKPVVLPVPLLLAVTSWMEGRSLPRIAGRVAVAAALMLAVVAPWTYRNYLQFDRFLLVSANGGWVMWWGNNPAATGLMPVWTEEQKKARQAGIIDLDARLGREAKSWIAANPGRFLALVPVKLAHTFGTELATLPEIRYPAFMPESLFRCIVQVFYVALALGFAMTLWRNRGRFAGSAEGVAALALVFLFILIHGTFIGWSFYHQPLLGIMSAFFPGAWRDVSLAPAPAKTF